LTKVKKHRDQLASVGINLVGKVLDARTAAKTNDGVAVAAWNYRST
jgi:hypothetical protein